METAKVDVRKLEILTERVNQVLEALNHVRLSVHGYQPYGAATGFPGIGAGAYGAQGIGAQYPVPSPLYPQMGLPFAPFIGAQGFGGQYGIQPQLQQGLGGFNPWQQMPLQTIQVGEADVFGRGQDPLRMTRLVQTFPNAFAANA